MAGSLDLHAACLELQEACLVALADTPDGAPECSYISPGPPPWDTFPCLIVYAVGPAPGDTFPLQPALAPGHRVTTNGQVNLVTITATILRCAWEVADDAPEVIDPAAITKTAEQTNADVWALWNHLRAAKRAGTLFAPREREFFLEPPAAVNQQGGAAGWQFTVRTELGGYPVGGAE